MLPSATLQERVFGKLDSMIGLFDVTKICLLLPATSLPIRFGQILFRD